MWVIVIMLKRVVDVLWFLKLMCLMWYVGSLHERLTWVDYVWLFGMPFSVCLLRMPFAYASCVCLLDMSFSYASCVCDLRESVVGPACIFLLSLSSRFDVVRL